MSDEWEEEIRRKGEKQTSLLRSLRVWGRSVRPMRHLGTGRGSCQADRHRKENHQGHPGTDGGGTVTIKEKIRRQRAAMLEYLNILNAGKCVPEDIQKAAFERIHPPPQIEDVRAFLKYVHARESGGQAHD